MPALRMLVLLATVPAISGIAYVGYLATGGTTGREAIKAAWARHTTAHTIQLTSDGGGECPRLGEWDVAALTCTMTGVAPTASTILINGDGITLDGAGYSMVGSADRVAVWVIDRTNVHVENLTIEGYHEGIVLQHTRLSTLRNLTIHDTESHAIRLTGLSNHNAIVDNVLWRTGTGGHGIALWTSHGNLIAGNTIVGTRDAVRLQSSHGNTITRNHTSASRIEGIDLHLSQGNTVVFNDLMEATVLPLLDDGPAGSNTFSLHAGGNHYQQFSTPDQGCADVDEDRYCDGPYRFFSSGVDTKPSVGTWTEIDLATTGLDEPGQVSSVPHAACVGCHVDLMPGIEEAITQAPDIRSILGRPVAGSDGFEYSRALRDVGGVWTEERLDLFLRNPQDFAPGNAMIGIAISDPEARRQIIEFIGSIQRD